MGARSRDLDCGPQARNTVVVHCVLKLFENRCALSSFSFTFLVFLTPCTTFKVIIHTLNIQFRSVPMFSFGHTRGELSLTWVRATWKTCDADTPREREERNRERERERERGFPGYMFRCIYGCYRPFLSFRKSNLKAFLLVRHGAPRYSLEESI